MNFSILALSLIMLGIATLSSAFRKLPTASIIAKSSAVNTARSMITITDGVEFDTIAREWRMKWSPDDDKKSLASAQQALSTFTDSIKKVDGVKSVQRVVCGGCLDFKVVIALPAEKFGDWVSIFYDWSILHNQSIDFTHCVVNCTRRRRRGSLRSLSSWRQSKPSLGFLKLRRRPTRLCQCKSAVAEIQYLSFATLSRSFVAL